MIQSAVCFFQEFLVSLFSLPGSDPYAVGHSQRSLFFPDQTAACAEDVISFFYDGFQALIHKEHQELISSEPAHIILPSQNGSQPAPGILYDLISCTVSVSIIDLFKIIHIQDQKINLTLRMEPGVIREIIFKHGTRGQKVRHLPDGSSDLIHRYFCCRHSNRKHIILFLTPLLFLTKYYFI